jgi:predicted DNA-binding transcriptional regulator YafY
MECSRATVFRTITLLQDKLRAPVVFDKEREGYRYDLSQGEYELPGLWFNARELQALVTIQRLLEELGGGFLQDHFALLTRRIQELTSKKKLNLSEIATRIRMPALGARPTGAAFEEVVSATLQRKKLEMEYRARTTDRVSVRVVSPQRVTRYRESWYLDAWDEGKQELRTFALDRIGHSRVLEERARNIEEDVLDEHFGSGYGIFSGRADKVAVLSFSPESARWVADEQWHPRQEGRFLPDGRYELRIPFTHSRELVMDILRHGPHVRVLEPEALALEVREQLAQALAQYRDG